MTYKNRITKLSKVSHNFFLLATLPLLLIAGIITLTAQSPPSFGQSLPDLTLTSGDIAFSNDQPMQYETITIYATVHNDGNAATSNITVRFYVIYENNFTYMIGDTLISTIDMNSSQQAQIDWLVDSPGIYEIKVCVDPGDTIFESNENNNNASRDLVEQIFYIICEDNAHTVPPGQSTTYLITIKDNQMCFCIHNFSLKISKPIFFSEWNSTLSRKYFDSGYGLITNVTLTVEVPVTTLGSPSLGMTAPITVRATLRMKHEPFNTTYTVCTYTTAGDGQINATIDIDPDTLNLKSNGRWITCYIELPGGYDVRDIDASTILLEDGLPPILDPKYGFVKSEDSYIMDHDNDTILERMVKFDRSEVEDMLSPGTYNLKVTGELVDGTMFEGYSDEIRVIEPP